MESHSLPRRQVRRPRVESLESRCLLSMYTVTTVDDNGDNVNPIQGSLREAIVLADSDAGSTIAFNVTGAGPAFSIFPTAPFRASRARRRSTGRPSRVSRARR